MHDELFQRRCEQLSNFSGLHVEAFTSFRRNHRTAADLAQALVNSEQRS